MAPQTRSDTWSWRFVHVQTVAILHVLFKRDVHEMLLWMVAMIHARMNRCVHVPVCACEYACLCSCVCLCVFVCVCRATLVATHLYIHSSISLWRLFSCLCSRQGSYLHVFLHLHFYVQQCHVNAGTMDNKLESIHNRLAMDTRTCFQLYQIVLEQSKHKHDMETTGFQRNHQNKSYVIMAWKQSSLPKMKWTK